ncbi:MAG TPA: hypothetical protein VGM03_00075 [Phycisphaerae bacterium]|jgi:hypothetical protein
MGRIASRRKVRTATAEQEPERTIADLVRADLAEVAMASQARGAKEACAQIAELASALDARSSQVGCTVFPEESGLALVFHSRATKRQITFEITADARAAEVIAIDEQMRRTARPIDLSDADAVRESLEWLILQA